MAALLSITLVATLVMGQSVADPSRTRSDADAKTGPAKGSASAGRREARTGTTTAPPMDLVSESADELMNSTGLVTDSTGLVSDSADELTDSIGLAADSTGAATGSGPEFAEDRPKDLRYILDRDLRDEVLSPEELALVEALSSTPSAARSSERVDGGRARNPRLEPARSRMEVVRGGFRTLAEALDAEVLPIGGARMSRHPAVILHDGELDPTGTFDRGWLDAPAHLFDHATVVPSGDLGLSPVGAAIEIALKEPDALMGWTSSVSATARMADRSVGVAVDAGRGFGIAGVRVTASFEQRGDLRVRTGTVGASLPTRARHLSASAVGRLLGRPGDPVRLLAGAVYHRVADEPFLIPEANLGRTDALDRLIVFGRGDGSSGIAHWDALVRYEGFDARARSSTDARTSLSMSSLRSRAELRLQLTPIFAVSAGGDGAVRWVDGRLLSAPTESESDVGERSAGVCLRGALSGPGVYADATLRVQHHRSTASDGDVLDEGARTSRTAPLLSARAIVDLFGPVAIGLAVRQATVWPNPFVVVERAERGRFLRPERVWSFEGGPRLLYGRTKVDLNIFASFIDDGLEPTTTGGSAFINAGPTRVYGFELMGVVPLTPRLEVSAVLAWADDDPEDDGDGLEVDPRLMGRAAVRYTSSGAFGVLEAHVRASSRPIRLFHGPPPSADFTEQVGLLDSFLRIGATWQIQLDRGIALDVILENVLDQAYVPLETRLWGAGIDLGAALTLGF